MNLSLIVAMDEKRLIGREGKIPWHLPADLKRFKEITMGYPVVMGRKTHESIGRVLPGRPNIVVTRNEAYEAEGCVVEHSLDEALDRLEKSDEIFAIGGEGIYREALPLANKLYVTRVEGEFSGDAYFPEIDWSEWREVSREEGVVNEKNKHPHTFLVYERVDS